MMPRGAIRFAIGIATGENGVDFVEPLVIDRGNLRRWLHLDHDTAALGKATGSVGRKIPCS